MDRSESFSTNGGPVGAETMQAMYIEKMSGTCYQHYVWYWW